MPTVFASVALFVLAGLFEIGGGWLVWQWLREGRPIWMGALGGAILALYGAIPTLQPVPFFGRVYAVYGAVFIVLSLGWGYVVDRWMPDRYDLVGAAVCLVGAAIMLWWPRG